MFTVQLLYGVLDAILKIVSLLTDPIIMFCLVFLFLNTLGYVLILIVIACVDHKGKFIELNKNSVRSYETNLRNLQLPTVSFIIPAHNEEKTIERKLRNTCSLNYPKDRLEVIVVDDGSTDRTSSILEEICGSCFPEPKIITQSWKGKSAAENKGLQNSKGEIIVISDADVPLNPDALLFMIDDFKDQNVGGVTCAIKAEKKYVMHLNLNLGLYARKLENKIDSSFGMSGPFVSFRKTIIPKIDKRTFSCDVDAGVTVRKKGYKVVYDPRIVSYVNQWVKGRPTTILSALRKLRHMSFGTISLLLRHKDVLFKKRYGVFGWIIAPRYLFLNVFAPVIFVLLSMNFVLKLIWNNLLLPFSLLSALFLVVTFLLRKIAAYSLISRALYLIFMYIIGYYARFFYFLSFILQPSQRRGIWSKV